MSPTSRIAMALIVLALITSVPYYIIKNEGRTEYDRLTVEVAAMREANDALRADNERQRGRLMAFRTNPRLIERWSRDRLSLARPDDLILVFSHPAPKRAPDVEPLAEVTTP